MIVRLYNFKTPHETDVRIEVHGAGIGPGIHAPIRIFDTVTLKEVARCVDGGRGVLDPKWRQIGANLGPTGPDFTYCDIEDDA